MIYNYFNINNTHLYRAVFKTGSDPSYLHRKPYYIPENILSHYSDVYKQVHNAQECPIYTTSCVNNFVNTYQLQSYLPTIATIQSLISGAQPSFDNLKNFANSELTLNDLNSLYPIAVRYTDGKKFWIIERPPFQATLTYKPVGASREAPTKTVSFWIPWTVMMIISDIEQSDYSAYLYLNDGPISSLDDLAVPCFHMNMFDDARMCLNQSYVMLQQHLANTSDYSIFSIYNFLLNDYFSGGWNTDLGINVFERMSRLYPSMKQIYNKILSGDSEINIKPATTPTGKVSYKKYYNNYFSYFSSLTLEESLSVITEIKKDYHSSDSKNYIKTFNTIIKDRDQKNQAISIFRDFTYSQGGYTEETFKLFIHPYHYPNIVNSEVNETIKIIQDLFYDYSQAKSVDLTQYNSTNDVKNLFIDKDFSIKIIDQDFNFNDFIPKVTANV